MTGVNTRAPAAAEASVGTEGAAGSARSTGSAYAESVATDVGCWYPVDVSVGSLYPGEMLPSDAPARRAVSDCWQAEPALAIVMTVNLSYAWQISQENSLLLKLGRDAAGDACRES